MVLLWPPPSSHSLWAIPSALGVAMAPTTGKYLELRLDLSIAPSLPRLTLGSTSTASKPVPPPSPHSCHSRPGSLTLPQPTAYQSPAPVPLFPDSLLHHAVCLQALSWLQPCSLSLDPHHSLFSRPPGLLSLPSVPLPLRGLFPHPELSCLCPAHSPSSAPSLTGGGSKNVKKALFYLLSFCFCKAGEMSLKPLFMEHLLCVRS